MQQVQFYECSLTKQPLLFPVVGSDGNTYERDQLDSHLRANHNRVGSTYMFGPFPPNLMVANANRAYWQQGKWRGAS